jgi:hypothetical protein
MECNGTVEKTDREKVKNLVKPNTWTYIDEFRICKSCGKIYWKGSHHRRMEQMIRGLGDLRNEIDRVVGI